MKNKNQNQPAYPCMPLQDKFGQLVVPVAGMSKLEHYALEIYKVHLAESFKIGGILPLTLCNVAIADALELLQQIENTTKTEKDETTTLSIIQ